MNTSVKKWPTWAFAALSVALVLGCANDPTDVDDDEPDDLIPPATVTDLQVVAPTPASLTLQWTAPGDDGAEGFASSYDLRRAQEMITPENFADAVRIDLENPPLPPGVAEDVTVDPLEQGQTYYFALKAYDDAGNVSGLSNCAHGTCLMEQVITIPDANLKQLLRESLQVPSGDFHLSDMLRLVDLAGNEKEIVELTGLEAALNLKIANLLGNQISDPAPLGQLPNLEALNLGMNQLTDLSSLQDLTSLLQFGCGQNQVTDISIIAGMTQLRSLSIHFNPLVDLSPLETLDLLTEINLSGLGLTDLMAISGKTTLRFVTANGNQISDITSLATLTELEEVYLGYNQLTDLVPLVDNAAFAAGDHLDARNNPLSPVALDEQIPALEARGVTVVY